MWLRHRSASVVPQVGGGIGWMVDLVKETGHEGLGRHGEAFGSWT